MSNGIRKPVSIASSITPQGYQLPGNFNPTSMGGNINIPSPVASPSAVKAPGKLGQNIKSTAQNDPGAFGQIAQGLAGVAGGIVGGRARRQEQRAARLDLERQRREYEQFEFQNPYANVSNPFEDLKVSTQASEFAAQQQQQALAGTLGGLKRTAGGSGIAALAQTLAQQQSANLQASAANIGQQETRNQMARAQGQQRMEQLQGAGAQYLQEKQFGRIEDMYETAATRKMAADEARRQATEGLIGGVANIAVGAGRVAAGGI
jgi:hypothetical protein